MNLKSIFVAACLTFALQHINASDVVTKYNEHVPVLLQDLFWAVSDAGTVGCAIATEDIPSIAGRLWWYTKTHPQATFLVAALLAGYWYMHSQRNRHLSITGDIRVMSKP